MCKCLLRVTSSEKPPVIGLALPSPHPTPTSHHTVLLPAIIFLVASLYLMQHYYVSELGDSCPTAAPLHPHGNREGLAVPWTGTQHEARRKARANIGLRNPLMNAFSVQMWKEGPDRPHTPQASGLTEL